MRAAYLKFGFHCADLQKAVSHSQLCWHNLQGGWMLCTSGGKNVANRSIISFTPLRKICFFFPTKPTFTELVTTVNGITWRSGVPDFAHIGQMQVRSPLSETLRAFCVSEFGIFRILERKYGAHTVYYVTTQQGHRQHPVIKHITTLRRNVRIF